MSITSNKVIFKTSLYLIETASSTIKWHNQNKNTRKHLRVLFLCKREKGFQKIHHNIHLQITEFSRKRRIWDGGVSEHILLKPQHYGSRLLALRKYWHHFNVKLKGVAHIFSCLFRCNMRHNHNSCLLMTAWHEVRSEFFA